MKTTKILFASLALFLFFGHAALLVPGTLAAEGEGTASTGVRYGDTLEARASYLPGDVNSDGTVSALDLTILSRALSGWPGYEEKILDRRAADLDFNGSVTPADRLHLARVLAGLEGVSIDKAVTVTESVRRTVPRTTEKIPVDTIRRGSVRTIQPGADGESIFHYSVTYLNGVEIGRRLEWEEVVSPMIPAKAEVGVGGTVKGRDGTLYPYSWRKTCIATYYNIYGYTYSGAYVSTHTAATNLDYIPLGTRMYIKNDRYDFGYRIAEDTGPLEPWQVDIWMPDDDPNAPLMSIEGLVRDMEVYFLE